MMTAGCVSAPIILSRTLSSFAGIFRLISLISEKNTE
jgi:hypothetical protein